MELKTYAEWLPILEAEYRCKVIDDDGARVLEYEGRTDDLLTKQAAHRYFFYNSIVFKGTMPEID